MAKSLMCDVFQIVFTHHSVDRLEAKHCELPSCPKLHQAFMASCRGAIEKSSADVLVMGFRGDFSFVHFAFKILAFWYSTLYWEWSGTFRLSILNSLDVASNTGSNPLKYSVNDCIMQYA